MDVYLCSFAFTRHRSHIHSLLPPLPPLSPPPAGGPFCAHLLLLKGRLPDLRQAGGGAAAAQRCGGGVCRWSHAPHLLGYDSQTVLAKTVLVATKKKKSLLAPLPPFALPDPAAEAELLEQRRALLAEVGEALGGMVTPELEYVFLRGERETVSQTVARQYTRRCSFQGHLSLALHTLLRGIGMRVRTSCCFEGEAFSGKE